MSWGNFRLHEPTTDPVTGRFRDEQKVISKVNRDGGAYILHSIERLSVLSDRILRGRETICQALKDYGQYLPLEQRQALERWCQK